MLIIPKIIDMDSYFHEETTINPYINTTPFNDYEEIDGIDYLSDDTPEISYADYINYEEYKKQKQLSDDRQIRRLNEKLRSEQSANFPKYNNSHLSRNIKDITNLYEVMVYHYNYLFSKGKLKEAPTNSGVGIDRIRFRVEAMYLNIENTRNFMQLTKGKKYFINIINHASYYFINIEAEIIDNSRPLISCIIETLKFLDKIGIFSDFLSSKLKSNESVQVIYQDISKQVIFCYFEVAFDFRMNGLPWFIQKNTLKQYKNSRYSKDYIKNKNHSYLCIYNRTKKIKTKDKSKIYRIELRIRKRQFKSVTFSPIIDQFLDYPPIFLAYGNIIPLALALRKSLKNINIFEKLMPKIESLENHSLFNAIVSYAFPETKTPIYQQYIHSYLSEFE